jgi:hypothetical protein
MPVPRPPDVSSREPLVEVWPAGTPLHRVHLAAHRPDEFNPGSVPGRFRPIRVGSRYVPTLYGAEGTAAALTETVFHDLVPEQDDQIVLRSTLYGRVRSVVMPRRDLRLVSLRGGGLRRLRTTARALIHSPPAEYAATAAYALALYRWSGRVDGLIWDSRLHPGAATLMLFGTRVRSRSLAFSYDDVEPLWKGTGLDEVLAAAEDAGVTLVI